MKSVFKKIFNQNLMNTICPIPIQTDIKEQRAKQIKQSRSNILTLTLTPLMCAYQTSSPPLQLRTFSYSIEEAMKFNHGWKIDDDQIKIMRSEIEKYVRTIEPQNKVGLPPVEDFYKTQIMTSLNKLTLENFKEILNLFNDYILKCQEFDTKYSEIICDMASQQRIFAPIYSMFTARILSIVQNPENIKKKLTELCLIDYTQMTEGISLFIGSLVQDSVFDPQTVYNFMKKLNENPTEKKIELLYNMIIPSGEIIELEISEAKSFFNNLFESAKKMKSRIRYLMSDLEECRENHWNVQPLMPSPVSKKAKVDQINKQFSPNEGERILREYMAESTFPTEWTNRMIKNVLTALLQTTRKVFDNGISIVAEMKEKKILSEKIAITIFRDVILSSTTDEVIHEFPKIKRRIGALFAQLVKSNIMQFSHFGSAFSFDIEIFGGFLAECKNLKMIEKIKNSPWMTQMRFKPKIISHLKLTDTIDTENMTDCWILYELNASIIDAMNDDVDPKELTDMIENEFPPETYKSIDFAEFITEVIVFYKPKKYIIPLSKYVKPLCDKMLLHIATIGEYYQWEDMLTRSQIQGFANLFNYNIKNLDQMLE